MASCAAGAASACAPALPIAGAAAVTREADGLVVATFYLPCLAQASYVVAHGDFAVIIDPRRDVDMYIDALTALGVRCKAILETHMHADFVSGHFELSERLRAPVALGAPATLATYTRLSVMDGDTMVLSPSYSIVAMATPGHTPACTTFVLMRRGAAGAADRAVGAFTGDTLFIGSCGRPDLLGAIGISKESLARTMFHSLNDKILSLPDDCKVYPGHGAGSACGKGLSSALVSTIGAERATNAALQYKDEESFVAWDTTGLPVAPQYFLNAVMTNATGAAAVDEHLDAVPELEPAAFQAAMASNASAVVLDTRNYDEYRGAEGHIVGSINIQIGTKGGECKSDGNFAAWLGTIFAPTTPLLIVSAPGKESESLMRCARIGYHSAVGVLKGGMTAWLAAGLPVSTAHAVEPSVAIPEARARGYTLLDVRTPDEFACTDVGHVRDAVNIPASSLPFMIEELDKSIRYVVYCRSGFRSSIASSFLQKHGFEVMEMGGYDPRIWSSLPAECTGKKAAALVAGTATA